MILYTLTNFQASKTLRMEVALFNFPILFQTVFIVSCSRLMWPWKKKTLRWNQFVYIITHSWLLFHHLVLYRSCLLLWNPYPPGEAQYLVDLGINLSSNFEPIFSPTGFGPYFPPSPEILHCTLKMASQPKLWNNNNLLNFKVNTSPWKSVCKTGTKKRDLIIWQPVSFWAHQYIRKCFKIQVIFARGIILVESLSLQIPPGPGLGGGGRSSASVGDQPWPRLNIPDSSRYFSLLDNYC